MKFLIGLATGLILAWGTPKLIYRAFDDLPPDPVGWAPRQRHWTKGVED